MRMTKVQAEALTAFIVRVREDWRPAGVMASLEKTAGTADVHDVACALIRLAGDQTVKTPGLLPQPGPHWTKPDGSKPHRRGDHTMRCPEHDEPYLSCQPCKDTPVTPPPTDVRDEITAALEQAKEARARATAEQRDRNERKNQP